MDHLCTGHLKVVEVLIGAGADLHIKNSKALTAVGCAANNGQPEVVLKLVTNGAAWRNLPDVNVVKTICRKTNYKSVICPASLKTHRNLWIICILRISDTLHQKSLCWSMLLACCSI